MERIDNQAADLATDQSEPLAGELDLYEELLAFVELSPEEQRRPKDIQEELSAEETLEDSSHTELVPVPLITLTTSSEVPSVVEPEPLPLEPVPARDYEDSNEQATETAPEPFEGTSADVTFAELNLSPEFIFTGALSKGVCLSCGVESGFDDLFCITCGIFIDEVGSTLPSKPACGNCGLDIVADEIFCPWCGSVVPAA